MKLRTLPKISFKNKKILLRIDINSALNQNKPLLEPRFIAHAKTVRMLSKEGAKVVILAHQGRKGAKDFLPSLNEHTKILEKISKVKIKYVDDLFGKTAEKEISKMKEGEVILLRNVRNFNDEENVNEKKNRYFKFSKNFDLYINDQFSTSHRNQGSIVIPPRVIRGYAGPVLEKEFLALKKFKEKENKKLLLILGGEKIEDYFSLFKFLDKKNTKMVTGGVLGNLILSEKGINLGYEKKWLKEKKYFEKFSKVKKILKKYESKIKVPEDFAIEKNGRKEVLVKNLPVNKKILDIGSISIKNFKEEIKKAQVVLMKGPLGFSEKKGFEKGTLEILKEISKETKKRKVYSLIGGGHLTTAIEEYKLKSNFSHVSLSGGAMIEFLAGEKLPGLEALKK